VSGKLKLYSLLFPGILLLAADSLLAERNEVLTVPFQPFQIPAEEKTERLIAAILRDALLREGFPAEESNAISMDELLAQSRDIPSLISGQYTRQDGVLILYGQIYNGISGTVIDACSLTEILDVNSVRLAPQEINQSDEERVRKFVQTIVGRLKSNPRHVTRWENIDEHLRYMPPGKTLHFPLERESENTQAIEEVFRNFRSTVTVGSNVESDPKRQPVAVTVISRNQIETSGARTLNELITLFVPGAFLVQTQDNIVAGFRGLAPDNNAKVLLLLNGENMNAEWFNGAPDSLLNGINLEMIDHVEVIRGPGSVTLGQGALLGVINIVTRNKTGSSGAELFASVGRNNYGSGSAQASIRSDVLPGLSSHVFFQNTRYAGQGLRDQGWAHDQVYQGNEGSYAIQLNPSTPGAIQITKNVAESGTRLGKAEQSTALVNFSYEGLSFQGLLNDQTRDLYNFYRDRNVSRNRILNNELSYKSEISSSASLQYKAYYTTDDTMLMSHGGQSMGGTREYRYGGSALLKWNSAHSRNRLAVGGEYRRYDMGQPDINGNNFIVNRVDPKLLENVNLTNRFVFPDSILVHSLFVEDFFRLTPSFELFAALRYDRHSEWGSNVSPRAGTIFSPTNDIRIRGSYEEGFRGANGISYAGGYQGDGFLRSSNFNQVAAAGIPTTNFLNEPAYFGNIPPLQPEKIHTYELAVQADLRKSLYIDVVNFYSIIERIIDVSVISPTPSSVVLPRIGTDARGDWNGYWFYRNLPGVIRSAGTEASLTWETEKFKINASESIVRVISASDSLYVPPIGGGMYLTGNRNHKHLRAFSVNIFRMNLSYRISGKWDVSLTYMQYSEWFSPSGNRVHGNHLLNGALMYRFNETFSGSIIIKNIFNDINLYPMNNNANDVTRSNGSPSVESRTYWLTLRATI